MAGFIRRCRSGHSGLRLPPSPGKPPVDVMLVIIAVVAASATLQASGGLDVMLQIAEKLLRRRKYVSLSRRL
ncbi:anaerobic C4-dicarboxylate transporter family protein [Shigella flexneri]